MQTFNLILIALMLVAGYVLYPQLPAYLPTHWNIQGQIDGYMAKGQAVWLMPLITLVMFFLFKYLPVLDPKKDKYVHFKHEWEIIQTALIGFFAYMHGMILYASVKGQVDITPLMFGGMGVLFTLLGNYLSKIRQNYFIGIKVPWTLNNEENWNKTHRFASWCFVLAGLTMVVNAFNMILPPGLVFGVIMLAAFLPILYSFLFYKNKIAYMKYVYIGLGVVFIVVVLIRGVSGEDNWVCQNGTWIRHGNPDTAQPTSECQPTQPVFRGSEK